MNKHEERRDVAINASISDKILEMETKSPLSDDECELSRMLGISEEEWRSNKEKLLRNK